MDGQTHAIGKAIRPLFADPVTYKPNGDRYRQVLLCNNTSVMFSAVQKIDAKMDGVAHCICVPLSLQACSIGKQTYLTIGL